MDVLATPPTNGTTTATIDGVNTGGMTVIPPINGVLKRHNKNHHLVVAGATAYKECLKNHAASMGGHAVDGCGEFMPSQSATATDPTSLKCAACGCHRNFHRRENVLGGGIGGVSGARVVEYHPQHRHHPPPPVVAQAVVVQSPGSDNHSPPPISSTYFPSSAPHMLLALSSGGGVNGDENTKIITNTTTTNNGNNQQILFNSSSPNLSSRKRFRTKFSQEQKEKMQEFAEKLGWKMQKSTDDLVKGFCNQIGVQREVFKVWMHNNKNTFGKRSGTNYVISGNHEGGVSIINNINNNNNNNNPMKEDYEHVDGNGVGNSHSSSVNNSQSIGHHHQQQFNNGRSHTNASSSSS